MASAEGTRIVGIDLGTTLSSMAYMDEHGTLVTIPNSEGDLTTPSAILFEPNGNVVVGREARRAALVEPERVADCVKRDMGEGSYHRPVAGKTVSPVFLSALILKKLKQDAEARIGPVGGVVITVPAYFDETRRQATFHAGRIAGLRVLDILNEPTSAALAYAFRDFIKRGGQPTDLAKLAAAGGDPHHAIVYDLGGGTLDVTVLRIAGSHLTVLATDGDVILGGRDWDDRIVNYGADLFRQQYGLDPRSTASSHQRLLQDAEIAKKDLSRREQTKFPVVFGGKELAVSLSRQEFEHLTADLLFRTQTRLETALAASHLGWQDIHELLAVGGSTRMPQVTAMLRTVSGKEPNCSLSPDEVVAHGAAIYGVMQLLKMHDPQEGQVSAGCGVQAGAHGSSDAPSPNVRDKAGTPGEAEADSFLTAAEEFFGEDAILAGTVAIDERIARSLRDTEAINVCSHSLGVLVTARDGTKQVNVIIPRNSPLPARVTRRYGTEASNQARVEIAVVEGESPLPEECIRIGSCFITKLPEGLKKGSPIDVTFSYDTSGCLHVRGLDVTSGTTAAATIMRDLQMDRDALSVARRAVSKIRVI